MFFFFKQKIAYGLRISVWSSDWCSSDLHASAAIERRRTMIDRGAPTRAQIVRQAWGGLKWTMPVRPSSDAEDRQSVGTGTSVSGRGDYSGRRIIKEIYTKALC